MKKCPHCQAELHDDSLFCFNCMRTLNRREEFPIPPAPYKRPSWLTPIICIIVTFAATAAFFMINKGAVQTAPPETSSAAEVPAAVTAPSALTTQTTPYSLSTAAPKTTTPKSSTAAKTTKKSSAATSKTTTTTTSAATSQTTSKTTTPTTTTTKRTTTKRTTTTTKATEPVVTYFSPEGASDYTEALLDYVNPVREKYGRTPLRASGKLDKAMKQSAHYPEVDMHISLSFTPASQLLNVGLPGDLDLLFLTHDFFTVLPGEDPLEVFKRLLKERYFNYSIANNDLSSMNGYTYISCYALYDSRETEYRKAEDPDIFIAGSKVYTYSVFLAKQPES